MEPIPKHEDQKVEVFPVDLDVAFAAFYRTEHDGQVRRAFLLTGSQTAAHDAVHDAFVEVYRRWSTIDHPGSYLNTCVLNRCRRLGRSDGKEVSLQLVEGHRVEPVEPSTDLVAALADLPFTQRAAIVLRYYGGFTEADIAQSIGCSPGSVGPAIHRGLKKLRTELRPTEEST